MDKEQEDYKLILEGHYTRRTLLHTEWEQYGGTMKKRKENIHLKKKGKDRHSMDDLAGKGKTAILRLFYKKRRKKYYEALY